MLYPFAILGFVHSYLENSSVQFSSNQYFGFSKVIQAICKKSWRGFFNPNLIYYKIEDKEALFWLPKTSIDFRKALITQNLVHASIICSTVLLPLQFLVTVLSYQNFLLLKPKQQTNDPLKEGRYHKYGLLLGPKIIFQGCDSA